MIDTSRHDSEFDRIRFGDMPVNVIGAGAVGSWTVLSLAQLGIENIHVWDDDVVEAHNLPNQFHFPKDVGMPKVDALTRNVLEKTGMKITPHCERINGKVELGPIVFMCIDTMRDRKTIWETCIRGNLKIKMMVESRMGVNEYRIYRIKPCNRAHIIGWEEQWYPDEEVDQAAAGICRAQATVGTVAMMLGAHVAHQIIPWFKAEMSGASMLDEQEQLVTLSPLWVASNGFTHAEQIAA